MTESQLADAIMHEPDMVKRLASIIDVGRKKYTSLIPNLEVLARDENYIVRSHAIRSLILFFCSKAHLPMAFALLSDDPEVVVRGSAASSLGAMGFMVPESAAEIAKVLAHRLRVESIPNVRSGIYAAICEIVREKRHIPWELEDSQIDWELISAVESGALPAQSKSKASDKAKR